MSNTKRRLCDPMGGNEYFATRLAYVDQIDGLVRLAFTAPSYSFDGEEQRVIDIVQLKVALPIAERARMVQMLTGEPARAGVDGAEAPSTLTLN